MSDLYQFKTNYKQMMGNIVDIATQYVNKNDIKALVLGLSGGIDSTITVALAREVANAAKNKPDVIGYALSINSKQDEIDRGMDAGKAFCDTYGLINLTNTFQIIAEDVVGTNLDMEDMDTRIRLGNIKARLRMIKLFDIARARGGMVLSTDNLTELLLGFWTLHGDVGNYGMIQNLWKTEVYGLAKYMADCFSGLGEILFEEQVLLQACEAIPTDGLGITNSDFDQLLPDYDKHTQSKDVYKIIDAMLISHVYGDIHFKDGVSPVVDKYESTHFKRNDPYNIPRDLIMA